MSSRAAITLLLLTACGGEAGRSAPTVEPTNPEVGEPTPEPAGFAIHEWGVLSFGAVDDGIVSAGPLVETAGHGGGNDTGVAFKPVVYAHLEGTEPVEFQVAVDARVVEHWPLTLPREGGITWPRVRAIATEACAHSLPATCPPTEDGYCESQNAQRYASADGACLEVDGQTFDHLLYRAAVPRTVLPFDVERDGTTVRLRVAPAAAEREVFRIRVDRLARTFEAVSFAPRAADTHFPEPSAERADAVLAQLFAGTDRAGLTDAEQATFTEVWRSAIRGEESGPDPFAAPARYRLDTRTRPSSDAIYYWLTPEEAARALPLRIEPPPTSLHRALLVRIRLNPEEEILFGAAPRAPELADGVSVLDATGIAREVAQRVVRVHIAEVRQCLTLADVSAPGFARADLTLGEDGRVTQVAFGEHAESALPAALECLSTRFYAWTFPNPSPPSSRITLSFRWTF